jgi:hypothetical protein
MRRESLPLLFLALTWTVAGQIKRPPGSFENDRIAVESAVYMGKEAVKGLIGNDFDGSVAVVEISVTPRGGEALDVEREDWTLFSNKDAQKAPAFHPSQLAGQGALILTQKRSGGGAYAQDSPTGTVIGGVPGTGTRPRQLGSRGPIAGTTPDAVTENKVQESKDHKEDPLLLTLRAKELPFGKTMNPSKGLLYFSLDGKHKLKDIELWYRGPAGKFVISFKP